MNQDLRAQIALLVEIQEIERRARRFQQRLDGVPERLAALDEKLRLAGEKLAQEDGAVAALKKQVRALEGESQQTLAKIGRSREKLMAVKTNKEYTLSLKEIEDLQTIAAGLDDRTLELLEAIETAESGREAGRRELSALASAVAREKERIGAEAQEDRRQQADLQAQAARRWQGISAEMLAVFRGVRARQPKGIAVAPVSEAVCRGCNMNIPPQLYNELQRWDSVKYCPNCQRIIYWETEERRPEPTERSLDR